MWIWNDRKFLLARRGFPISAGLSTLRWRDDIPRHAMRQRFHPTPQDPTVIFNPTIRTVRSQ